MSAVQWRLACSGRLRALCLSMVAIAFEIFFSLLGVRRTRLLGSEERQRLRIVVAPCSGVDPPPHG